MVDEFSYSQTENGKRDCSDIDIEGTGQNAKDLKKDEGKKKKQIKKTKSGHIKIKRMAKRNSEDRYSNDCQRYKDTIEEFTRERSLRISKERLDIVESRSLCMNVSQFCGLTPAMIQERIQQDLETITNAISAIERSESDVYSNSPVKESERDNRS